MQSPALLVWMSRVTCSPSVVMSPTTWTASRLSIASLDASAISWPDWLVKSSPLALSLSSLPSLLPQPVSAAAIAMLAMASPVRVMSSSS